MPSWPGPREAGGDDMFRRKSAAHVQELAGHVAQETETEKLKEVGYSAAVNTMFEAERRALLGAGGGDEARKLISPDGELGEDNRQLTTQRNLRQHVTDGQRRNEYITGVVKKGAVPFLQDFDE